jgi:hypothetical protein
MTPNPPEKQSITPGRDLSPALQAPAVAPGALEALGAGVGHYENFPVASWLCPPWLRPTVAAIYRFARTADDIADEGQASAAQRLADLAAYRDELARCLEKAAGGAAVPTPERWPGVFGPLGLATARHNLPGPLLHDLLSAFEQDVRYTEQQHRYASTDELLGYCRLSANPVGRLLLHLYGVNDARSCNRATRSAVRCNSSISGRTSAATCPSDAAICPPTPCSATVCRWPISRGPSSKPAPTARLSLPSCAPTPAA